MKSKVCDSHMGEKNPVNRKETHGEMTKVRVCRGDKVLRKCAPKQPMLQFYTANEGNKRCPIPNVSVWSGGAVNCRTPGICALTLGDTPAVT